MPDKGEGERHDVGETHDEREAREEQSAKEVRDLAGELKGTREDLADKVEGTREDLADKVEGTRDELAAKLEADRKARASGLKADREELAVELEASRKTRRTADQTDRLKLARRVQLKGRADVLIVGALLLAVTVIGWVKVNHFTSDLRSAAVGACHRQNVVRQVVNANLRDDIVALQKDKARQRQNVKDFKASNFGITQAKFDRLIQEGIDRSNAVIKLKRVRIKRLPNAPCDTLYPAS